jgi:prepilin-type N-terminal cleavage/methylation domain-containing protein
MSKNYRTKAFTLVELIVVITILSVLATIAFVSFQWYVLSSRDSVRLSDIKNMWKIITIFQLKTGKYPIPNDNININYSWSIAWHQWVFWQNSYSDNLSMWSVPLDPLTLLPYSYSVTNTRQEYQFASVLEWDISKITNSTFAWDQIVKAYVIWDYNKAFLKVVANSTTYILWLPSIITSDISDVDLVNILNSEKLVYNWYNNLPASYSWSIFNINPNDWFDFVADDLVLFEWNISELEDNQAKRIEFFNKLQSYYSDTNISTKNNINKILLVDNSSDIKTNNYAAKILNNTLKTKIPIIEDSVVNITNEIPCVFWTSIFSNCGL